MSKNEFVEYCRNELFKSMHNAKSKQANEKQKYRTEGLLHAARLMDFLTADEVAHMIDEEHMRVFGESVEQRRARKLKLEKVNDTSLDDYFDIPAIDRQK